MNATIFLNIWGCFLASVLLFLSEKYFLFNNELKLLFITGFCYGFTTFSMFSVENLKSFKTKNYFILSIYIEIYSFRYFYWIFSS
ncbi:MAG: CrcB family protein [Bacteroidales bacterium]|nr:CrcB family protein [Bacteroidales bacterium]